MKVVIAIILAIVILGGGGYLLFHKQPTAGDDTSRSSQTSQSTRSNTSSTPPATEPSMPQASNTITFDGNSFQPAEITVAKGATITVKNTASTTLQFDSDPHPVHTDDTDLNLGTVVAGQSKTFTVTKTGSFGFHDHLNPNVTGKITIQ